MGRKRKCWLSLILFTLMIMLSGCDTEMTTDADPLGPSTQEASAGLMIKVSGLSTEPLYFDWNQNGTDMQLIALKDSAGEVHLAYNTCQSCAGSPYAYFEYQNGVLVCQNCRNSFDLASVGRVAGGCNPMPVTEYQLENGHVVIPAEVLAKAAPSFRNWKVIP